jgi:3-deoxy-D-manno-octulosonic-acid transferase
MLLFDAIYLLAGLLATPWLVVQRLRTGEWPLSIGARMRAPDQLAPGAGRTILVHAVSVGEANATRGLISLLADERPSNRIVISATTDTGFSRARVLFGANHAVVRLPLDFSWMARRFLDSVQPDVVVLMELEVWPNLVRECERRRIPVCVVNGRVTESSLRGYGRIGGLLRSVFGTIAAVGAQTEEYARRFVTLGVPADRIRITDTMKWDNVPSQGGMSGADELALSLGLDRSRPLVVAGSTGPGEERMLLDARQSGLQLLLVPRKPERFDEVAQLEPAIVRWTGGSDNRIGRGADVYLLDTMGKLDQAYALADIAIIGRSLVPLGGSDPIPPVALGCPVVIGPYHDHFAHVVEELELAGAIKVSREPMETASELLADPQATDRMVREGLRVIRAHQGASAKTVQLIIETLSQYSS